MTNRIYNWRSFTSNKYEEVLGISASLHEVVNDFPDNSISYLLSKNFIAEYKYFQIPSTIEVLLDELFLFYNLTEQKSQLIKVGISMQMNYSDNYSLVKDDLLEDFDIEYKDFRKLLEVLKDYLFSENLKRLPEISFKPITKKTTSIKNFFVKWDIYQVLCNGFDLTKDNFEKRSQELLNKTNRVIVNNYSEKVKVDFIQGIYNHLKNSTELSRADILRFIGVFFRLFQVKINNKDSYFEIYNSLRANIESVDLKNLNHYLTRPPKLYHY